MTIEMGVLQTLRLKGRATTADVVSATGGEPAAVQAALETLVSAGHCEERKERYTLTRPGRAELDRLLAAERTALDASALDTAYRQFDTYNSAFKQLVTDWQLIDGTTVNDHTDAGYDAKIVARLGQLHERFLPSVDRLAAIAPRLSPYPARFTAALEKVRAGDHRWLARPLIDSYHTVWFELHEDLIGLTGRSRVEEAAAGRAE